MPILEHSSEAVPSPQIQDWKERRVCETDAFGVPELRMIGWTRFAEAVMEGLNGHRHTGSFEFCYILQGSLTWWVEQDILDVGPNDIYITWPDELHGGVDGMMHPAELVWVIIDLPAGGPALGLAAEEVALLLERLNSLSHRRFQGHSSIADHFRRILAATDLAPALRPISVRASLHLMLLDILAAGERAQAAEEVGQRTYSRRVSAAVRYMRQHIGEPQSLDQLAEAVGLKPSYFREEFRRETGFSPVAFVTLMRVREARRLLIEDSASITDIAFRLGFNTSQYFATVFRRYTGMTPRNFRNQAANGHVCHRMGP